jgi:hypothetical protein
VLDEEQEEDDTPLHCFHVVDRLWNMDVGIFSGKYAGDSLYYLDGGTCYYLGLNMEGYVKMLIATRGFMAWQWALISHRDDMLGRSRDVVAFETHLPRLFPEVSIPEVYALYDSLYISEVMAPGTE